jgi:hypothetical protein
MPPVESSAPVTEVARRLARAGIRLPEAQSAALAHFLDLLMRWNRVYNLTGIRDLAELVDRHLIESLALRPLLKGDRVADVGTGQNGVHARDHGTRTPVHAVGAARSACGSCGTLRPSSVSRTHKSRTAAPNTYVPTCRLIPCSPAVAPGRAARDLPDLTAPGSILLLLTATHCKPRSTGRAGLRLAARRARSRNRAEASKLDRIVERTDAKT